ncbi:MAG TPA: ArsB/NhaD family transporter [Chloroflexota bacterium]|nr:ArsB/NhaD family transporter [Chloroflexota bacterium]
MHVALAALVAVITLALIVTRPAGLNEGITAVIGALAMLVLGLVPVRQALAVEVQTWNIFLFFLGMMAIAALSDQSGVFDRVADGVARVAGGRVVVLYLGVFVIGAGISLLFANDSAALVLTPIVYALVLRLALDPLPFVYATTFIADTASIGFPVSNPLNVIMVDRFHLTLGAYVSRLWLPAILVILVNLTVFLVLFRRSLRGRFADISPRVAVPGFGRTLGLLAALAAAYLAGAALRFPLGVVAVVGAGALALNLATLRLLRPRLLVTEISWPIFGFIAGMLIVVQGLHDSGITALLGRALVVAGTTSPPAAIAAGVVGSAAGSNVINNLPMALVMVSTIHSLGVTGIIRSDLIFGSILGCDLGPNLTHLGSLATLIWLLFLRRKGLNISALDYLRIGAIVTPPMLVTAVLGLWLTGR